MSIKFVGIGGKLSGTKRNLVLIQTESENKKNGRPMLVCLEYLKNDKG
ncbi:hypothetical protein IIA28_03725 [candidate division KSB1 bacterium]|nr:hypothetical protein [candidate division KSB1 bacterium]